MVEAVREGYLLHYGEPRLLAGHDADLALLAGDYLYALGLERLAALGDDPAVAVLADLISDCAQLHAEGRDDEAPGSGSATERRGLGDCRPFVGLGIRLADRFDLRHVAFPRLARRSHGQRRGGAARPPAVTRLTALTTSFELRPLVFIRSVPLSLIDAFSIAPSAN